MGTTREFLPIGVKSRVPAFLALTVGTALLSCALLLCAVACSNGQVLYVFRKGELTIDSGSLLDGRKTFAASDVISVRTVGLTRGRRVRGTAAQGVCTGRFWYPDIGHVWQATDCAHTALLLMVKGEKLAIAVSPPDFSRFVSRLTQPSDGVVALPPGQVGAVRVMAAIFSGALMVTTALVLAVFLLAPKRLRYMVGDGCLIVRTLFRRRLWLLRDLSARAYSPVAPSRVIGASMPGYYTGLFSELGGTMKVYATDLRNGILLEGAERLYLSPAEPDAFLSAVSGKRSTGPVDNAETLE